MNSSVLGLLIFAALAAGCAAVALAIRDLCRWWRGKGKEPPAGLRRLPREPVSAAPRAVGAFDRWFSRMIREAGSDWSPIAGALFMILCGLAAGGALFLFSEHPVATAVGVLLGMGAALNYLVIQRRRRVRKLQEQLPSALDMLARSVRAGQSVDEAVVQAGQQLPEPLAREFRFCANQLALGLSLQTVMRSLEKRVPLFDVRILSTSLAVHRETGGNLANVLERLAGVVRDRLSYRRQLRSTTSGGRFSATLIAAIGPLLFLYLFFFHANYVHAMLEAPLGQVLLIFAAALQVIGLVWTARLLKPVY